MTKLQFLEELRSALGDLPQKDIEGSLEYYAEMIDDRIESGMSEVQAISGLEAPKVVAHEIKLNMSFSALIKSRLRRRRTLRAWEFALLILGSPLWLSLMLALLSVIAAVYLSFFAVIASLWAVEIGFAAGSAASLAAAAVSLFSQPISAIAFLGAALIFAGLTPIFFLALRKLTGLFLRLTLGYTKRLKYLLMQKEK